MGKKVKLLPWPNPNWKENPYQKILYKGLRRHDLRICRTPIKFSLIPVVRKFEWLHLNWPETLYCDRDPKRQAKKFNDFIGTLSRVKDRGRKIIWTMHNAYPHDATDIEFHRNANQKIIDLSDLIHVHFTEALTVLNKEYQVDETKIYLMSHALYENYYGDLISKEEARKSLGIPDEARAILSFGNLRKYKGIEKAVESFLKCGNKNLYFIIAGEPENEQLAQYLKKSQKKNPRLILQLAKIKDRDFVQFFSVADAFLFPSQQFFTSGSVMLALTYNLPVIAVPKNHTLSFLGKSFFIPWDPPNDGALVNIFDSLDERLARVNYDELEELHQELNAERLTLKLSEKLKEGPNR